MPTRNTFEAWIPEDFGSNVIQRVTQVSALEAYAQKVPMGTQTRSTPRSAGVGVGMVSKGGTYSEDASTNDEVVLRVQKFGQAIRIAEEDIDDSLADIVNAKTVDWATAYAKTLDNACLAVTAAKGTSGCAFDSLYYLLTQADASTGYSANANITASATGAPATGAVYGDLSTVAGIYEGGDYFDEADSIVIAHPRFKRILRGVLDAQSRPIFQEGSTGVPGGAQGQTADTVFGYRVHWSLGAKTSAVPTPTPTGNPLMVIGNPRYLLLGVRSGPETVFIDGRNGLAALTDESILKMRSRRAFAPGVEQAFSIYEYKGA
ncbi:phage major capsid protein [Mycobacterium sp.]|uniref:phage major capsid protein n=1 Tax=Mycobacterium sp. TaxID=1785 RepID=UPI002602B404|nr:phage major capsid protein [Mycobacterium sp.]